MNGQTDSAFRYIDLFAGIGGFAAALEAFGGECVYSVEIDPQAAAVYERNWGHSPLGDITKDAEEGVMTVPPMTCLLPVFLANRSPNRGLSWEWKRPEERFSGTFLRLYKCTIRRS